MVKRRRRRRRRRRPLYRCMVKMAMACLKHKPGATRQEIERKVMNIYKKRGLDDSKHPKAVRCAINSLMKARCVHKRGHRYQIVPQCARDALSVHKRRRKRGSRGRFQRRSPSQTHSRSGSRSRSPRPYMQRKSQRAYRRRKKRRRCQSGQTTPTICHLNVRPQICSTNPCPTNPSYRFPLRDAMIIAMTIFFSYWMQRTASHMQFSTPNVPIHLN